MISILIPVFNRDVNKLVTELARQLALIDGYSEIIVLDDGSDVKYVQCNDKLTSAPNVRYIQSATNTGRILAREKLARTAKNEWLLFLDCDSVIVSDRFLETYFQQLPQNKGVIVGGRIYTSQRPNDCSLMLHWKYGSEREVTKFGNINHTNRFMTNNFLIPKTIFQQLDFSNGWSSYGYEDTWMAVQFESSNVPLVFIDNPVLHDGIENYTAFIAKSEQALHNLKKLSEVVPANLVIYVKLYHYYHRLKSMRLLWALSLTYLILQKSIENNLRSCAPSLTRFDLYRLNYFTQLMKRGG